MLAKGLTKNSTKETQHLIPLDQVWVLQGVSPCGFFKFQFGAI